MTKILFMGTPDFSATVLKGLISDERYEILAVVTQPDRAVGRKKEIRMTPVKEAALEAGLPIYQPEKLSGSQELEDLLALGADGIVTAAFGQFLPSRLLEAMKFSVNVHASLLPKYRGGAPIHYAIMNGDKEAGVTIMEMVKEMDAGDMISKVEVDILDSDNKSPSLQISSQKKNAWIGHGPTVNSLTKFEACILGRLPIPYGRVNALRFTKQNRVKVKENQAKF